MLRNWLVGLAAVAVLAAPAGAQRRGTFEFGAFGAATSFDNSLQIDNGIGYGLRVGMFVDHNISFEVDGSMLEATRPAPLANTHYAPLYARASWTTPSFDRMSLVLSGGVVRSYYRFTHNFGASGLLGAKIQLSPSTSLRLDGIADYMPTPKHTNYGFRAGLSFFRVPAFRDRIVTVSGGAIEDPTQAADAAAYRALRDSLNAAKLAYVAPSSARALELMRAIVFFRYNEALLTPDGMSVLDSKIPVFQANPNMRILVIGNTDARGSDNYNLLLGLRRAEAARNYLVSHGVAADRIEITTRGERNPAVSGTSEGAWQQNRRDEFQLMIGEEHLVMPQ